MPDIEAFITRWKAAGGTELANYQLFLTDLSALLELPRPEPATGDARTDSYVFERPVKFVHGDGTESAGRMISTVADRLSLKRRSCARRRRRDLTMP